MIIDRIASSSVTGSAVPISDVTVRPLWVESPRFPCRIPSAQCQNCVGSGWPIP
jgi:hypothetical protein